MVQSHYADLLEELQGQLDNFEIPKKRLFPSKKEKSTPFWQRLQERTNQCAICDQVQDSMGRHYQVFFPYTLSDKATFAIPARYIVKYD